jgi:prepilin-type N-terminal cleavage/methylation domain-containing protein
MAMKRHGFGLIEVLVAMALALILIVGAAELLTFSLWAKRKGDITAALTGALTARLEGLKSLPFEDAALEPGGHAETVRGEPGGCLVSEEWDVADAGERMKRISLRVRYAGRPGPETEAVLFISKDLGFRP